MSNGFEFFEGARTESKAPQVTVRRSGQMVLKPPAVAVFGEDVTHVELRAPGSGAELETTFRLLGESGALLGQVVILPSNDANGATGSRPGRTSDPERRSRESVPTIGLEPNHCALIDGDTTSDTVKPVARKRTGAVSTTADTGGCLCEQVLAALGAARGLHRFGCTGGMLEGRIAGLP